MTDSEGKRKFTMCHAAGHTHIVTFPYQYSLIPKPAQSHSNTSIVTFPNQYSLIPIQTVNVAAPD